MTDEELRAYLLEWVNAYCVQEFAEATLPGAIKLFLAKGVEYLKNKAGITSESLGDYSISGVQDFPISLQKLLVPYRKLRVL